MLQPSFIAKHIRKYRSTDVALGCYVFSPCETAAMWSLRYRMRVMSSSPSPGVSIQPFSVMNILGSTFPCWFRIKQNVLCLPSDCRISLLYSSASLGVLPDGCSAMNHYVQHCNVHRKLSPRDWEVKQSWPCHQKIRVLFVPQLSTLEGSSRIIWNILHGYRFISKPIHGMSPRVCHDKPKSGLAFYFHTSGACVRLAGIAISSSS